MSDQDMGSDTSTVQFTVAQAAQHAGVSSKTIRRWMSKGRLAAQFNGQAYVIDRAELDRAMTNGHAVDAQLVPSRGHGRVASMSVVLELLDRLERQAGEIAALRLELRALQAATETRPGSDAALQPSKTKRRRWWQWW